MVLRLDDLLAAAEEARVLREIERQLAEALAEPEVTPPPESPR
jgi:hypothetical protein